MNDRVKSFAEWFEKTSYPVGLIATGVLLVLSARAVICTGTCAVLKYKCEFAIQAEDAIAQSMADLVSGNPDVDIVAKRRK